MDNERISRENMNQNSKTSILFDNVSFCWDKTSNPVLKELYFEIPSKSLVAIIGDFGSGKSSLLSAIIGDLFKLEGDMQVNGSLGYVPQIAWIQNATIKDNILFKTDCDEEWYQKVVHSCALDSDFKDLPAGDETEVGENGTNLSGGQKQRICLSRAVYHDSDIYLFDDPLSSVDAQTARHIFHEVIGPKGLLFNKTRVWVTNNYSFLSYCDSIILLKNGKIQSFGTFDEIKDKIDCEVNQSVDKNIDITKNESIGNKTNKNCGVLIKEEEMESEIKYDDIMYLLKRSGLKLFIVLIIVHFSSSFADIMSDLWLTKWIDNDIKHSPLFGLTIYLGLIFFESCFMIASNIIIFFLKNELSFKNFQELLTNTVHLNLQFFDVTPIGRITTRLNHDLYVIDHLIPFNVIYFLEYTIRLLSILLVIIPLMSYLSIVLIFAFFFAFKLQVSNYLILTHL